MRTLPFLFLTQLGCKSPEVVTLEAWPVILATQEAATSRLQVQSQFVQQRETLSQNKSEEGRLSDEAIVQPMKSSGFNITNSL